MIVRHQRPSKSGRGFSQLARYIRGRGDDLRATWFLAANLPGVASAHDVELACRLVEAVQAQNTRAANDRTYHLVISLHQEDRSLEQKELRHVVETFVDTPAEAWRKRARAAARDAGSLHSRAGIGDAAHSFGTPDKSSHRSSLRETLLVSPTRSK